MKDKTESQEYKEKISKMTDKEIEEAIDDINDFKMYDYYCKAMLYFLKAELYNRHSTPIKSNGVQDYFDKLEKKYPKDNSQPKFI